MYLAVKQIREKIKELMEEGMDSNIDDNSTKLFKEWIEYMENGEKSKEISNKIIKLLDDNKYKDNNIIKEILKRKDYLVKKSQWIVGRWVGL